MTRGGGVDSGVPAGAELVTFAEAVMTGSDEEVHAAREALRSVVGDAATVDAAAVIGNFERMVRIADGTGIPLDTPVAMLSADISREIGTDQFATAANTPGLNAIQKIAGRALGRVVPYVFKLVGSK